MTPPRPPATPGQYVVAVRALCEFTAKQGDLDLRFTPSPTAQEGIAGHALVRARRPASYEAEIALCGEFGELRVRGRADGYDPARNQLEEIKTTRGDLARMRENHRHLHWAQLKIYGALLCRTRQLDAVRLALVYFDIGSGRETVLTEDWSAAQLQAFFEIHCERFLGWARQELAHRAARDAALAALAFPHADFRPGQRQLAEAVYRGAIGGRRVLAQAPTGIGKTVGTLFPVLKASPGQALDKIFYLAAKTSGRALALEAMRVIDGKSVRIIELVARDKACEYPGSACHGEACVLARGFYDRLPAARDAALRAGVLDQRTLRETALAHDVCPYYLGQEMVRWSDVIAGDYNYYFDLNAMLHGLAQGNQWRVAVLVDEAHNLLERARGMYSATLDPVALKLLRRIAPEPLKKVLGRVSRAWNALAAETGGTPESTLDAPSAGTLFPAANARLLPSLQEASAAIADYCTEHPVGVDPDLLRFHFDALHFLRIAELFDKRYFSDSLTPAAPRAGGKPSAPVLTLRNIVPAPLLAPRFATAHSTTLFSATLTPWAFYADTLGLPADSVWIDVASPFRPEQLSVRVVETISTRWQDRDRSLQPLVDVIGRQYRARPGNYLSFFSSYDYLQRAIALFRASYPDIPVREQAPRMSEADQAAFLADFTHESRAIGFAVLGGAFAEGIDLPGHRLIGAFIATLGLPQWSPFNEEIRLRMADLFGAAHGYDYAYLYPGIRKVVQAAGRVIRAPTDEGVVYLLDDRFARAEVRKLLPDWWQVERVARRGRGSPG
ncbi:ATP-dependent DNA helicase [Robbsia sp. Bb-Pol-6]|uniref:ATP-dependent DNA helicase n=1 Tax=Robbsia betulipollinis TaxID=2981849 RepID=A0ABT3ZSW2_9BURK|nr:ATP-dependent DNA helicase [Robbsia betulipollinis]MCY0389651.1 ATP-dependent DNA helicase [Robbsia betulipollinis]